MEKFRFESVWGSRVFSIFTRKYGRDLLVGIYNTHPIPNVNIELCVRNRGEQNVVFGWSMVLHVENIGRVNTNLTCEIFGGSTSSSPRLHELFQNYLPIKIEVQCTQVALQNGVYRSSRLLSGDSVSPMSIHDVI